MYSTYWNFNALIGVPGILPSCQTEAFHHLKTGFVMCTSLLLAKTGSGDALGTYYITSSKLQ